MRKIYLKSFLLLFILTTSLSGFSQNAGISANGAITPNAAAGLDVNFTNKGLLIPRVALVSTTSFSPLSAHVAGMVIYNTATIDDVTPGFYFDNGTKWVKIEPKTNAAGDMQYWDGTKWVNIPIGSPSQFLKINQFGIPAWSSN